MSDQSKVHTLATAGSRDPLGIDELPPLETHRWTAPRKAQVVEAVRAGQLTLEDACRRYNLSAEELKSWESALDQYGLRGLRIMWLQELRRSRLPAALR